MRANSILLPLIAAILAVWGGAGPARAWDLSREVVTEFVERDGGFDMTTFNHLPVPLTATYSLELTNMKSSAGNRFTVLLPARSRVIVSRVAAVDPSSANEYRWEWHWLYGDAAAEPARRGAFRLPYADGERYEVTEARGTCPGHQDAMLDSIDWSMPEGTPIVAIRDGIVVEVESRFDQSGGEEMSEKANFVTMVQADGSLVDYVHLRCGGVTVAPGQFVRAGELIGYSGNTGWSSGPHLHLRVFRPVDGFRFESLPVRFCTVEDAEATLCRGDRPTACALTDSAASTRGK